MGDKSAEQKLIREYGLTENDIAKIKKYRYLQEIDYGIYYFYTRFYGWYYFCNARRQFYYS